MSWPNDFAQPMDFFSRQKWIRSPVWDSLWVLSGIPLGLLFYALSWLGVPEMVFIGIYLYFLGAHVPAPVVLAWRHPEFRAMMLKNKKRYVLFPVLFPLSFAAIGLLAGLNLTGVRGGADFLPQLAGPKDLFNAILVFFWIYIAWNGYHFSAQNFGVLSIYRNKVGEFPKEQRWLDMWFCHLNLMILMPLCWYLANYTFINSALVYFPRASVEVYHWGRVICMSVAGFSLLAMLAREIAREERFSIPRFVLLLNIGLMPIVIFESMAAFNAMYGISHFLTAIGLTGHILSTNKTKKAGRFDWKAFYKFYLMYFCLIAIFPCFLVYKTLELEWTSNGFLNLAHASIFLTTVVGFRFGLAIVHFLYDRFVYKFSRPEVRMSIGSDLLSPTRLKMMPEPVSAIEPTAQVVS